MARNLSLIAKKALFSARTDEVFLVLLTISGAGIVTPLRVVNNTQNIISRGNIYLGLAFDVTLPDERSEELSKCTLRIDNVDRQIVLEIRKLTRPPSVDIEVILASSPDIVEAGPFNFTLRGVKYNVDVVEGTLYYEDVLNEPYPGRVQTPANSPGLFR